MSKHRLVTGGYSRTEETGTVMYKKGDVVEGLSPEDVARLTKKGMLEEVSPRAPVGDPVAQAAPLAAPPKAPKIDIGKQSETHWSTVRQTIEESDSAAFVQAVLDAEKAGKGRVSILDAASTRLAGLGENI